MRIVDSESRCISFHLNLLGVRVWSDRCQLLARNQEGIWQPLGPPSKLPIRIPADPAAVREDGLLITVCQYDRENPGTDLYALLTQEADFDAAVAAAASQAKLRRMP